MTFDSQHLITIPDILLAVAQDLSAFIDPYILSKHYRESWLFICLRFITKPPNDFMQKKKKKSTNVTLTGTSLQGEFQNSNATYR